MDIGDEFIFHQMMEDRVDDEENRVIISFLLGLNEEMNTPPRWFDTWAAGDRSSKGGGSFVA
jgi:hypothetical protein